MARGSSCTSAWPVPPTASGKAFHVSAALLELLRTLELDPKGLERPRKMGRGGNRGKILEKSMKIHEKWMNMDENPWNSIKNRGTSTKMSNPSKLDWVNMAAWLRLLERALAEHSVAPAELFEEDCSCYDALALSWRPWPWLDIEMLYMLYRCYMLYSYTYRV